MIKIHKLIRPIKRFISESNKEINNTLKNQNISPLIEKMFTLKEKTFHENKEKDMKIKTKIIDEIIEKLRAHLKYIARKKNKELQINRKIPKEIFEQSKELIEIIFSDNKINYMFDKEELINKLEHEIKGLLSNPYYVLIDEITERLRHALILYIDPNIDANQKNVIFKEILYINFLFELLAKTNIANMPFKGTTITKKNIPKNIFLTSHIDLEHIAMHEIIHYILMHLNAVSFDDEVFVEYINFLLNELSHLKYNRKKKIISNTNEDSKFAAEEVNKFLQRLKDKTKPEKIKEIEEEIKNNIIWTLRF